MPSSGVGGPCNHCGVDVSCCWRRGPPLKPVLCNACGSRYLVKKSLDGYIPIQQRSLYGGRGQKQGGSRSTGGGSGSDEIGGSKQECSGLDRLAGEGKKRRRMQREDDDDNGLKREDSLSSRRRKVTAGQGLFATTKRTASRNVDDVVTTQLSDGLLKTEGESRGEKVSATEYIDRKTDSLFHESHVVLLRKSLRIKPRKPVKPKISVVF